MAGRAGERFASEPAPAHVVAATAALKATQAAGVAVSKQLTTVEDTTPPILALKDKRTKEIASGVHKDEKKS